MLVSAFLPPTGGVGPFIMIVGLLTTEGCTVTGLGELVCVNVCMGMLVLVHVVYTARKRM